MQDVLQIDESAQLSDLDIDDVRQFHRHLQSFEAQYEKAQAGFRRAATIWIIAGVAGVGIVLATIRLHDVSAQIGLPANTFVDPFSIAGVIACFAAMVVGNLWQMDQGVYQRMWHSVFTLGIQVEQRLPRLERVRTTLYAFTENASPISAFYRLPLWSFFALQTLFFVIYVYILSSKVFQHGGLDQALALFPVNVGVGVILMLLVVFSIAFAQMVEERTRRDDILDKTRKIENYLAGGDYDRLLGLFAKKEPPPVSTPHVSAPVPAPAEVTDPAPEINAKEESEP